MTTASVDILLLSVKNTLNPVPQLEHLYGGSLALLTDLYQLTMACGYWKAGTADEVDSQGVRGFESSLDTLFRVRVERTPAVVVRAPEVVTVLRRGLASWDLHPDGKRFIVAVPDRNGGRSTGISAETSRHVVILNWFTELNELTDRRR